MRRVGFLLGALLFAVTACGSDGPEPQPEESSESQQLMLKYAQCMRDNGVDLPDPVEGKAGSLYEDVDQDSQAFTTADKVCSPILQGLVDDRAAKDGGQGPDEDQMLELAECLREHGVDVQDPVPGAEKPFGDSLDRTDPAVAKALAACGAGAR
ncbi:hypothetical protein [Actinophytocola oryzae]|uniref:Secreted protein n=1 Tax=Actinophytocola oryzae TaxID=502181 RepID=A0A4R7US96_9PSEU|nr:hypothetical protein [Actinophytocola oryzae]TDV37759.1 hypothetical protein CLV71_12823 [Actinophytocola oryzae]